ncbi:ATP adenylyltransferase [Prochlorococcus sp. MIT 1300]|uniref:ATP adenylyltransferase n=1 Tax=Prochlorococcus sp. MIT 1300 TaxID=3096218 RepID=UPI002A750654|nr:ATP adenylyltransferase [Prochlorococcus sp. MIT 1300]
MTDDANKDSYWRKALIRTNQALENGALVHLRTKVETLTNNPGNDFELRSLSVPTPAHLNAAGPKINPFRPWDKRLEIECVSKEHVLILNKYPVHKGHMLLITKRWEPQNGWISIEDWNAIAKIDYDTSGLWFFNSSSNAGASQPHRHLQLLRRASGEMICPREDWFIDRIKNKKDETVLDRSCLVIQREPTSNQQEGIILMQKYCELVTAMSIGDPMRDEAPRTPYNLLITPRWIAVIKRRKEGAYGFSINGLGFAGYLLSTEDSDIEWLQKHGPTSLIESVVSY